MDYSALYEKINYKFKNEKLLTIAFTHPSVKVGNNKIITYDRLEFLGDAILNFVISDLTCAFYPDKNSGDLTKIRQTRVNNKILANVAKKLDLGKYLIKNASFELEKSEKIFADLYEALVAAIYKDSQNIMTAYDFIFNTIMTRELEIKEEDDDDDVPPGIYRTEINEHCQKNKFKYEIVNTKLDDGTFKATLTINKFSMSGEGHTKKVAEEEACRRFYNKLIRGWCLCD